jgi:branched-chain amino acid transport system substrate-binding protein
MRRATRIGNSRRDLLERLAAASRQDEARPLRGQRQGRRLADAAPRARDPRHLALEMLHAVPPMPSYVAPETIEASRRRHQAGAHPRCHPRQSKAISATSGAAVEPGRAGGRREERMTLGRLFLSAALAAAAGGAALAADGPVKIGVLNDMSSLYADIGGKGSVESARMAAEDAGPVLGQPVQVISADHLNKPDVGSNIARQWYDTEGVDVITDVPTSSVGLAVNEVSREKKKLALFVGPATSDLTGPKCSPYSASWVYDTWALAHGTGSAVVKSGGDTWFFITADYAFGHALERDTAEVVKANGGKVLGDVKVPLNSQDFSSFLLQAQASKAKIIGLANAGGDTINSIKQGAEFGIVEGGQKFAGLLIFITDVHSLGLKAAQGLQLTSPFYWDMNDETRAFSKRFQERVGHPPSFTQAGVYSAMHHYLEAVKALGSKDPDKVMEKMRETPINDFMTKNGKLRIDGRVVRDMYLFEVKKPAESKGAWDYYKLVQTIPAAQAFRPLDEGGCPLVKKG